MNSTAPQVMAVITVRQPDWTAPTILETLTRSQETLRRKGVRSIGLFGSYRRGTATAESDIDLLVTLDQLSFDAYMDLRFFLEDLFGRKVDLVLEHTLQPRLRPYVLEEVIYVPGFSALSGGYSEGGPQD